MQLGDVVKALRLANGWSQPDLAARVNACAPPNLIKHQHIQQLEAKPSTMPKYLLALARAFGKSVEDLHEWRRGQPVFGPNFPAGKPAEPTPEPFDKAKMLEAGMLVDRVIKATGRKLSPVGVVHVAVIAYAALNSGKKAREVEAEVKGTVIALN